MKDPESGPLDCPVCFHTGFKSSSRLTSSALEIFSHVRRSPKCLPELKFRMVWRLMPDDSESCSIVIPA